MSVAIKVENLSKAYQIGQIGTGTISRDLERWWITKVMKREDPFLKLGETNDRNVKGKSDIVWSLKDINFDIQQGDAVGIIGKNGAGKSTLLKLLSRVTSPTTGKIKIKGRVASLLEVGTGFHPELTGRENIYLNGSILGMRKKEINRKLDEIIDFSGVERYIDTPVKRYSSGMYVRLAFAVAAHLESEILIVDEVLAVGDAEFQKKCLGKMNDVSKGEGKTVLFVSHNLASIKSLCNKGILLINGQIELETDSISNIISHYTKQDTGNDYISGIKKFGLEINNLNSYSNSKNLLLGDSYGFGFLIKNNSNSKMNIQFNTELKDEQGEPIYCIGNQFNNFPLRLANQEEIWVKIKINEIDLRPGLYKIKFWCRANDSQMVFSDFIPNWAFKVEPSDYLDSFGKLPSKHHGPIIKKYKNKFIGKEEKLYVLEV